jgi:hypothetical protein
VAIWIDSAWQRQTRRQSDADLSKKASSLGSLDGDPGGGLKDGGQKALQLEGGLDGSLDGDQDGGRDSGRDSRWE